MLVGASPFSITEAPALNFVRRCTDRLPNVTSTAAVEQQAFPITSVFLSALGDNRRSHPHM